MLFTPDNANKVLLGRKTQTRRPVGESDILCWAGTPGDSPLQVKREGRLKWQEGKDYAVQPGRGKASIGKIHLKRISRERVNSITDSDAVAEGIKQDANAGGYDNAPTLAFRDLWNSIYSGGMAFETGPMVWVLEFELVN